MNTKLSTLFLASFFAFASLHCASSEGKGNESDGHDSVLAALADVLGQASDGEGKDDLRSISDVLAQDKELKILQRQIEARLNQARVEKSQAESLLAAASSAAGQEQARQRLAAAEVYIASQKRALEASYKESDDLCAQITKILLP